MLPTEPWALIAVGASALVVPGALIALCWGARRADAALAAAPITVLALALLGLSGEWLGPVFTYRNAVSVLVGLAVLGLVVRGVIALARRLLARRATRSVGPPTDPRVAPSHGPTVAPTDQSGEADEVDQSPRTAPLGRLVTFGRAMVTLGPQPRLIEALAGLAITTWVAGLVLLGAAEHNLEIPMQSWDAPSHVNTIRHMAETGIADPTHAAAFTIGAQVAGFYPNEFRTLGAGLMWVQPIDAVVASNLAAILVAGLIWPSSVAIFARSVLGRRRAVTWLALTLSLGSTALPWQQLGWGVLWPTATGAAMAPLVMACAVGIFGLQARRRPGREASTRWWQRRHWPSDARWRWLGVALLAPAMAAAFLGHPRTLVLLIFPGMVVALAGLARAPFRLPWYGPLLLVAGVAVSVWLGYQQAMRAADQYAGTKIVYIGWGYTGSLRRSITDQLSAVTDLTELGRHLSDHNTVLAVATLVGVVAACALPRGMRWLVVCWAGAVLVQAMTTSPPSPGAPEVAGLDPVAAWHLLVGGSARPAGLESTLAWWYGDAHRSSAMVPVFSTVLAVVGVTATLDALRAAVERGLLHRLVRRAAVRSAVAAAVACAVVVALGVTQLQHSARFATDLLTTRYAYQAERIDGYVSAREVGFMKQVGTRVGRSELVLNNPTDGSAFLYGLTGTRTVFVVSYLNDVVKGGRILHDTLVTNPDKAAICSLVARTGVRWVLNMGPTLRDDVIAPVPAPGMQIPPNFWLTTEELSDGQATLYRITGCPGMG